MSLLADIDALVSRGGVYAPRWGWHDDHREADGTEAYLPALQQVRGETETLIDVLMQEFGGTYPWRIDGACLQLGIGECDASHHAWRCVFERVVSLDWGRTLSDDLEYKGVDIAFSTGPYMARELIGGQYDFLLIDAGHSCEDARRDHANYGPLVRPGGIIAFHDALRRPGFEEAVQVWRYLETLSGVTMIGTEVGVAWIKV